MRKNLPISGTEYLLQDGQKRVSTSDAAGRIIYANRCFVEVSGYCEDELNVSLRPVSNLALEARTVKEAAMAEAGRRRR